MREILFKAKKLSDSKWAEGSLVCANDLINTGKMYILPGISDFSYGDNGNRIRIGCFVEVDPSTVCQYTNIDTREECGTHFESHKIFTGDVLGEWTEDEDGNEYIGFFGIVTYWDDEGRYVLADENGLCNDWTLEDEAQPENWPNLIHCGNIHDGEGGQ